MLTSGDGWFQRNSGFQTQQYWCTNELAQTVAASTRPPAHVQAREGPAAEIPLIWTWAFIPYHPQVITICKGKISSLPWSLTGYVNHPSGIALCPAMDGQHKTNSIISVDFLFHTSFEHMFCLIGLFHVCLASDFVFLWCVCFYSVWLVGCLSVDVWLFIFFLNRERKGCGVEWVGGWEGY